MNARAPRRHLPAGLYEARPYVAIVVGGIAAIGSLVHALSLGEESALACVVLGVGCLLVLYGGMTKQMRNEHRRRIRMIAAIKAEWRRREVLIAQATAAGRRYEGEPALPPVLRASRFAFLKSPEVRGALACIVGGTGLAGIALFGSLEVGDMTAWDAGQLALGSIIALYGGLLSRAQHEG